VFRLIDTEQGKIVIYRITDNQLWNKKRFYTVDLDILKEQITVSTIDIVYSIIILHLRNLIEWFKYASKTLNCDYQQNSF
jgi:hypothetical protein